MPVIMPVIGLAHSLKVSKNSSHLLLLKRDGDNTSLMSHWLKTGSIQGVAQYIRRMCEAVGTDIDVKPWQETTAGVQSQLQLDGRYILHLWPAWCSVGSK
jgi:hypothetical protein